METNLKTIKMINVDREPIVIKKEDKFLAVSIEVMNGKYVVGFDIIEEKNIEDFDISKDEYETIAIVECFNQDGGYIDCRNELLRRLDANTIEGFKSENF